MVKHAPLVPPARVSERMVCRGCRDLGSSDGMLPYGWGFFEVFASDGRRERVYFCRMCVRSRIPQELRVSAPVIAATLVCGPCGKRTPRLGLDERLPDGWMRLQIAVDGLAVRAGGEQGSRMYFCPTCGPLKVPTMLKGLTGNK
jgi:hypothetical protein